MDHTYGRSFAMPPPGGPGASAARYSFPTSPATATSMNHTQQSGAGRGPERDPAPRRTGGELWRRLRAKGTGRLLEAARRAAREMEEAEEAERRHLELGDDAQSIAGSIPGSVYSGGGGATMRRRPTIARRGPFVPVDAPAPGQKGARGARWRTTGRTSSDVSAPVIDNRSIARYLKDYAAHHYNTVKTQALNSQVKFWTEDTDESGTVKAYLLHYGRDFVFVMSRFVDWIDPVPHLQQVLDSKTPKYIRWGIRGRREPMLLSCYVNVLPVGLLLHKGYPFLSANVLVATTAAMLFHAEGEKRLWLSMVRLCPLAGAAPAVFALLLSVSWTCVAVMAALLAACLWLFFATGHPGTFSYERYHLLWHWAWAGVLAIGAVGVDWVE